MAEVVGLVLGAVGVAGVIGAFKDVVDLYSLFVDSKNLGQDYELLDTKLDIEKTMLLHWAERVGLLRPDYDRRLDEPNTSDTVFRVLASIRSLLSDASELTTRYGVWTLPNSTMITDSGSSAMTAPENTRRAISGRQMERLTRQFDDMRLRKQIPKHTGLKHRFRWAVRDKQQFETLLQHLSHFTTKLDDLIPATAPFPILTQSDLDSIRDLQGLKLVLEASLSLGRSAIADAVGQAIEEEKRQQRILDMLWFRTINAREKEIAAAHAETMDWALRPPRDGDKWDDLAAWLRAGEGIYWVSGKAGSGKSTLMKRLVQHSRTKELLGDWAGGSPCNLVNFFFWYHGTPEQQSLEGLSRSLLHQILSQHRSAIPEVLPEMWKELEHTPLNQSHAVKLPSPTETKAAFKTLGGSKASEFGRFCVFIDGLDEFTGDYQDAIAFIKELTTNPCFKVVVSSRPIPDCRAGFEHFPGLRLQDLTRRDITKYVDDVIGGHKHMRKLITRHPVQAQELRDDLVVKSSGVFLWVVLACRSLLSGFAHSDQLADLQSRLTDLPPQLEDMFKLMLSRIDKRNREQGAFMLRVCYGLSSLPRDDKARGLVSEEPEALGLALLAQPGGCQPGVENCRRLSQEERRELCEDFEAWLGSRCGGLLELSRNSTCGRWSSCFCVDGTSHEPLINRSVVWMHRTVFEFLQDEKVWDCDVLQRDKSRPGIPGSLGLYGLYCLGQKPFPPSGPFLHSDDDSDAEWKDLVVFSGMMAARADMEDPADGTPDLTFQGLYRELEARRPIRPSDPFYLSQVLSDGLPRALCLSVQFGALNSLKAGLQRVHLTQAGPFRQDISLFLAYAVLQPFLSPSGRRLLPFPKPVVSWLLASGANPNIPVRMDYRGCIQTLWVSYLESKTRPGWTDDDETTRGIAEVTAIFLAAGADPKQVDAVPSCIVRFIDTKSTRDTLALPLDDVRRALNLLRSFRRTRLGLKRFGNRHKAATLLPVLTGPQKRRLSVSQGSGKTESSRKRTNRQA
jgi:hypothetical protein